MNTQLRMQAKTPVKPAFIPVATGLLKRKCACGNHTMSGSDCAECGKKKQTLQRESLSPRGGRIEVEGEVPPIVHEVLRSPGKSLDATTLAFMEPRFGHDFSRVRVHSGAAAEQSARDVSAHAYAVGHNIVFGVGRFAPETDEGRRLIAHELTHVVQQSGADGIRVGQGSGDLSPIYASPALEALEMAYPGTPSELEAESMAESIREGQSFDVTPVGHVQLSRQPIVPTPSPRDPLAKVRNYDRSQFGGLFDAEVSTSPRLVTLIMSIDFTPAGWLPHLDPSEKLAKFKPELKEIIESTWSFVYALKSICHGSEERFQARVRLLTDGQNPHTTIFFYPNTPGGLSGAGGIEHGLAGPQAALQESDTVAKEHKRYFQPDKKKSPEERTFSQVTAAHEFGHLIGLNHIRCPGNEERCYGLTPEEAIDIMGLGSSISPRDYTPFQQIMKRYGQDTLPPICNEWKLVESG